jgi:hypothetical protein
MLACSTATYVLSLVGSFAIGYTVVGWVLKLGDR